MIIVNDPLSIVDWPFDSFCHGSQITGEPVTSCPGCGAEVWLQIPPGLMHAGTPLVHLYLLPDAFCCNVHG